jgi:branched-chain amino acid transport system substrate-binding protein
LQLAKKEINENGGVLGKPLDVIVLNDRGDTGYVVEQYRALREKGAIAIVGSVFSDVTLALAKAAEKDGIPIISPTASNPEVTKGRKNVFRVMFLDNQQAEALAAFSRNKLGARTALVISGDKRYEVLSDIFENTFRAKGGQIIARERYSCPSDFDSILKKYKKNQPDVIFSPTDYIVAAKLAEAAHRAELDRTKLVGTDAWDGILAFLHEPSIMDRVYYASPFAYDDNVQMITQFSQKYFDLFSFMPLSTSALSYSALQVLVQGIEKAQSTDSEAIAAAMRANVIDIITGQIAYDKDNNSSSPHSNVYIMRFKDDYYSSFEKIQL